MNPLTLKAKLIAGAIILLSVAITSAYGGYRLKTLQVAERDLAIEQAAKAFTEAYRTNEGIVAKRVEEAIAGIRITERVINHEVTKIIDRPVYLNQCLDADGVRLIEQARTGRTDTSKPAK